MRLVLVPLALLVCCLTAHAFEDNALEDDDFAEFEQFEADDSVADVIVEEARQKKPVVPDDDFETNVETEDDIMEDDIEFEHFQDPEEFEGFQDGVPRTSEQPKITISKVPVVMRSRLDAYWLEGILCCVLMAYGISYAAGRVKNTSIATNFLKLHRPLLEENFTLVGETGLDVVSCGDERGWRREAEHCFTMWCSGRTCCEGMLLTLKLIKRQDLANALINIAKPAYDTLQIRVELGKDDSDPFVLCVAQKKVATRLAKEMQDLSVFCPERRPGDKHNLPPSMSVMSECAEATTAILDSRVCAAILQYQKHVQYIHISDRFCGAKQQEETASAKPPETEKVMLVSLALGDEGGGEEVRPLLLLVFYLMEKIKRLRLSKEALSKCEKRRQKVSEVWMRGAHAQRQEQAALRREEKRKLEKEKILAEDDPEKQRRWEQKELKREQKRKQTKMKQLKMKAL